MDILILRMPRTIHTWTLSGQESGHWHPEDVGVQWFNLDIGAWTLSWTECPCSCTFPLLAAIYSHIWHTECVHWLMPDIVKSRLGEVLCVV